jgi:peroxiredoxin
MARALLALASLVALSSAACGGVEIVNEPRPRPKPVASADKPVFQELHAEVGEPVPPITLHRLRSEEDIELYRMRGDVIVVYFFAAWSKSSVAELSTYRDLAFGLSSRKVSMLAVAEDADESVEKVQLVVDQNAPDVLVALDRDHKLGEAFGVEELPAVAVIDREGVVRFIRTKPNAKGDKKADLKAVESKVLSLLK